MRSPIEDPACYPGELPDGPVLVAGRDVRPIAVHPNAPLEAATVENSSLDRALAATGAAPVAERWWVLAVGSNACPAQLAAKFAGAGVSPVIPLLRARVSGLRAGHSAHVSRPGYVPAIPVEEPGASSELFVLALDAAQLAALDRTEPNYRRVSLDRGRVTVDAGVADPPDQVSVYRGRRGAVAEGGTAIRLTTQAAVHRLFTRLEGLGRTVHADFHHHLRIAAGSADYRECIARGLSEGGHVVVTPLP